MTRPARTIFLGTGDFAVPIVSALAGHPSVSLVAVVSAPARPGSRGRLVDPPAATWAIEHGLPLLRPERLRAPESVASLAELQLELIVLADYGQIVPQSVLDLPRSGSLNVHPSLLPRHRGSTPVPASILAGDTQTGVSVMLMDAGLDTGPIVGQSIIALAGSEIAPDLESVLAAEGAQLLVGLLRDWLAGELQARPQPDDGATLTRPLRRADGRLDATRDAVYLERQVRAYQPWPGTFFDTPDGRVIIWSATAAPGSGRAGTIVATADRLPAVVTGDGLLELVEVQPAGGRRMSGADLLRGRPALVGQSVG